MPKGHILGWLSLNTINTYPKETLLQVHKEICRIVLTTAMFVIKNEKKTGNNLVVYQWENE